jgi:hypothetical protein
LCHATPAASAALRETENANASSIAELAAQLAAVAKERDGLRDALREILVICGLSSRRDGFISQVKSIAQAALAAVLGRVGR